MEDGKPWAVRCDVAFPCASQNELNQGDAMALVNAGCRIVVEGWYTHPSPFDTAKDL